MAYEPHLKIKPSVLADAAVEALNEKLVIANTVTQGVDVKNFRAAEGDKITMRVKGTLPVRQYAPRNDRSKPIVTDVYKETTVDATISDERPYSAVRMTDEQKDWDFDGGWGDVIDTQIDGMAQYYEHGVLNHILNAPYERIVLVDDSESAYKKAAAKGEDVYFNMVVAAKSAMRRMRTPDKTFTCLVGLDLADALVKSNKMVKNQGTGDSALSDDSIGTIAGVNFVASVHIPSDQAFMYASSGFVLHTGVPSIPNSVPFGATAKAGNLALRWLMDYDTGFLTDRSVFDAYAGYGYTKDRLTVVDQQGISHIGEEEYFVRGVQLGIKGGSLGSTERVPGDDGDDTPGGAADSWLAKAYKLESTTAEVPEGTPWPLGGNDYTPIPKADPAE